MKLKKLVLIYIVFLFIGATISVNLKPVLAESDEAVVIPDEAIRLRILANSNSDEDQELKRTIRDEINSEVSIWVEDLTSIQDARNLIQNRLGELESIVETVLKDAGIDQSFTVEYGKQVKFPTKLYGAYIYPAGDYEAILISLGKGQGDNWWCVLFPPLCFLDFGNGVAVDTSKEELSADLVIEEREIEIKFLIVEWFSKLIR